MIVASRGNLIRLTAIIISVMIASTWCSTSSAGQRNIYRSSEHKYSIEFPAGWSINTDARMRNTDVVARSNDDSGNNMVIVVAEEEGMGGITMNIASAAELKMYINMLHNEFKRSFPDIRLLGSGETFVTPNVKAVWLKQSYTQHIGSNSYRLTNLTVQAFHKGKSYTFTCLGDQNRFSALEPLCNKAINSFIFEDRIYP